MLWYFTKKIWFGIFFTTARKGKESVTGYLRQRVKLVYIYWIELKPGESLKNERSFNYINAKEEPEDSSFI